MSGDPEQRPTSCREFVEDLTGRQHPARRPKADASAPASRPVVPGLPGRGRRDAHGQGDDGRHPPGAEGRAARRRDERPGQPEQAGPFRSLTSTRSSATW